MQPVGEQYVEPPEFRPDLLNHRCPVIRRTDIALGLDTVNHLVRKRAVVFLVSDLLDEGFERQLRLTARRHDLISVILTDPREEELPRLGLIRLQDAETGRERLVDTSSPGFRQAFAERTRRRLEGRDTLLRRVGIDRVDIRTDRPYERPLLQFFSMRERRYRA